MAFRLRLAPEHTNINFFAYQWAGAQPLTLSTGNRAAAMRRPSDNSTL